MPAIRALLVALDEWVVNGREPPPSRLPRIADGTLVRAEAGGVAEACRRWCRRARANDVVALGDWTDPQPPARRWQALVPQVDSGRQRNRRHPPAGHRGAARHIHRLESVQGIRCRRASSPIATAPILAFATTRAEREQSDDPRPSLAERYPTHDAYAARVRAVVSALQRDRLLLRGGCRRLSGIVRDRSCWPSRRPPDPPHAGRGRVSIRLSRDLRGRSERR